MERPKSRADNFLTISPRLRVLPIIHGSGEFTIRVRDELLARPYDCVTVPLPPSFQEAVEESIVTLPTVSIVAQLDIDRDDSEQGFSYVPIDPCQGVIAALRTAIGERIAREFIDMETPRFEAITGIIPDPYALKRVSPEQFSAAILPAIPPPQPGQHAARIAWMAARLRDLEVHYRLILLVASILDWPWIREAYRRRLERPEPESFYAPLVTFAVDPRTLLFVLGELPSSRDSMSVAAASSCPTTISPSTASRRWSWKPERWCEKNTPEPRSGSHHICSRSIFNTCGTSR